MKIFLKLVLISLAFSWIYIAISSAASNNLYCLPAGQSPISEIGAITNVNCSGPAGSADLDSMCDSCLKNGITNVIAVRCNSSDADENILYYDCGPVLHANGKDDGKCFNPNANPEKDHISCREDFAPLS